MSGPGTVTFGSPNQATTAASFGEPGAYALRLTANDSALSSSDEVSVTVNPVVPPPMVSLSGLPDGAEVTTRVNITGTVSAGSNWKLEYCLGDGTRANWTTLASGNTPVTNGLLGVFDPTLLLNGTYTLRLVAADAAAQTTATSVSLIVSGEQKIGNFSLSFNDLKVAVAGLPIGGHAHLRRARQRSAGRVEWAWISDLGRNRQVTEKEKINAGEKRKTAALSREHNPLWLSFHAKSAKYGYHHCAQRILVFPIVFSDYP